MASVANHKYLGRWYARRLPLSVDEKILLASSAFEVRIKWLGSSWPGILHLTNKRLVFTPGGLLSLTEGTDLHQIRDVDVIEARPLIGFLGKYCILRIELSKRTLEFAFFGRLKSQRKRANEWKEAIIQWAPAP
jgi:hypothetical protein